MSDTTARILGLGCMLIAALPLLALLGALAWMLIGAVVADPTGMLLALAGLLAILAVGVAVALGVARVAGPVGRWLKLSEALQWIRWHRAGLTQLWFTFWLLPLDLMALSAFGLNRSLISWEVRVVVIAVSIALVHYAREFESAHAWAVGALALVAMLMGANAVTSQQPGVGVEVVRSVAMLMGADAVIRGATAGPALLFVAALIVAGAGLTLAFWRPWKTAAEELLLIRYGLWKGWDTQRIERLIVGETVLQRLRDGEWHEAGELFSAGRLPGESGGWSGPDDPKRSRVFWWLAKLYEGGHLESDLQTDKPMRHEPRFFESDRRWRLTQVPDAPERLLASTLQD